MVEMTPRRRVLAALMGGKVDRVPATCIGGCGGSVCVEIQEAVGIYWPEAHRDAEKMAKLSSAAQKLTGFENLRAPYDFAIMPEALGCKTEYRDKPEAKPGVREHPFKKPEDLSMPDDFLEKGRIPAVLEALSLLKEESDDFLPVSSFALGPFSLAGQLTKPEDLIMWTVTKPDYVEEFVKFSTEVVIEYANAQYRAGSDVITIGEPLGAPDIAGPDAFRKFVKPALIKLANNLQGIKIFHPCGDWNRFVSDVIETGFDGISTREEIDIMRVKPQLGDIRILGNISSKGVLTFGSPEEVKTEARKALKLGVDLLEPACGVEPLMPLKNIKALVEVARESKKEE